VCGARRNGRSRCIPNDESLLDLTTAEDRIMVTFNVRDFARIIGERLAGGGHHAGCLLIVGIDHGELGLILRVIGAALEGRPDSAAWCDHATWCPRRSGLSAEARALAEDPAYPEEARAIAAGMNELRRDPW